MTKNTIRISRRGDDGFRIISVRIRESTLSKIDDAAEKSNRSRNEIINILLVHGIEALEIEE
jgi:metal-responsive CopG/Arc/MetJ family transcriptional regulator